MKYTKWLPCLCGVFLCTSSLLAGTPPTPPEGLVKIEWLTFRANALAVVTQAVPGTYTGLLSWNPEYKMSEKWGLGLNLGYSIYRKTNTEIFSVLEYAVTGSYEIEKPWSLELIAGAQTWISSGQGTGLLVGLNGKHTFKEKQFGLVDHVVAGYSAVFQNQAYHLVRLGVGLKF